MERDALKRLLVKSKEQPVQCAMAMSSDPQLALLMVDKIRKPKALEHDLVKENPDARSPRFGMAVVDTERDAKLVQFHINKAAPGIARRLLKTLKGTGFVRVEIITELDGVVEAAGEEEVEAPGQAVLGEAGGHEAVDPAPGHEAALKAGLVQLMRRLQSADPGSRAPLVELASQASALLKAGDLAGAAKAAVALRQGLDAGAGAAAPNHAASNVPPAAVPGLSAVRLGKAALLWRGMWAKADKDLRALGAAVVTAMQEDEEVGPEEYAVIEGNLRDVQAITTALNLSLADELDELRNAEPPEQAATIVQLRARLSQYAAFLESDETVQLLADNEFLPITVQADLMTAVHAIEQAITPPPP